MDTQFENFSKIGCLFKLFKLMMNPLLNIKKKFVHAHILGEKQQSPRLCLMTQTA